ncbi:hypothetical protein [Jejuia pallidilutea]|uniref:Lipocalin-like domain-containing protein n=1 Tax=Jejuia pallidilutea TaxID=504487 RepID=A0A090VYQ3_9FLAO|nr:hypothetical protein [Jejuia pallidilutea]PQV49044.1 hypothetical protein CLV33_104252 [Jejuia pallidilutea]GAL69048.1 hypothetical protein JCM19301_1670 [Jejuia pallidilutea]GAL72793.1 hypothetical protein JCM19302_1370 [Jejuia pallidilutea]GAL90146.1 hypothetical protein JCM19538_613 [Jejuia pallidilutea]
MKFKFLIPIVALFFLTSCNVNNDDDLDALNQQQELQIYQWHLTNVSGGVDGIDIDFEADTIIWVFSVDFVGNGNLEVENNNTDDTLEDGLDTGTYPVSIPVYDNQSILFVDGNEFAGVVTPTEQDLIMNQNIKSTGETSSDGFIYTFKRKIVVESN